MLTWKRRCFTEHWGGREGDLLGSMGTQTISSLGVQGKVSLLLKFSAVAFLVLLNYLETESGPSALSSVTQDFFLYIYIYF